MIIKPYIVTRNPFDMSIWIMKNPEKYFLFKIIYGQYDPTFYLVYKL